MFRSRWFLLAGVTAGLGLGALLLRAQEPQQADDLAALRRIGLKPTAPELVEFFRRRTPTDTEKARLAEAVRLLGDDTFVVREQATLELILAGRRALPLLREALKAGDLEVSSRADRCVKIIESGQEAALARSAARLLAREDKPGAAVEVLLAYLPFAEDEQLEEELLRTLAVVGLREQRVDSLLSDARTDAAPARRAAAGWVLGRSQSADERALVMPLLRDADPRVRLRAAQGLVFGRDKAGVPALVDLLTDAPPELARQAEGYLYWVAGEHSPVVALASDDLAARLDQRRKSRDVWQAWWKSHHDKVDLTGLDQRIELDPDTLRLVHRSGDIIREVLTTSPQDARQLQKAYVSAFMIAVIAQHGQGGPNNLGRATLRDVALRLADALRGKRIDEASKLAKTLLYRNIDYRASLTPIRLDKRIDVEELMSQFTAARRGGLDIERKFIALDAQSRKMNVVPADALNDELLINSLHISRVAELLKGYENQPKKQKEWRNHAEELRVTSTALADAVKKKDGAAARTALVGVNNACAKCHDTFR